MKSSWFLWWISFLMLSSLGTCLKDLSKMDNETREKDAFCDKMEEYNWQSAFHDCFVVRKYKDGGQDLDNIIHRILKHADACTEISRRRGCRLDYGGFKFVLSKVIEQMKDYSIMYMEAITKGRKNVKDLECVEDILTLQTYVGCFKTRMPDPRLGVNVVRRTVEEGLTCANEQNLGCSNKALGTFNRIVKTLLGVKPPHSESSESAPTTPAVPKEESTPTNRHMENSTTTNRHMEDSTPTNRHMEDSTPSNRPMVQKVEPVPTTRVPEVEPTPTTRVPKVEPTPTTRHRVQNVRHRVQKEEPTPTHMYRAQKEEPKPEPPMRWYHYIFKPFVAVWNYVKSWFG